MGDKDISKWRSQFSNLQIFQSIPPVLVCKIQILDPVVFGEVVTTASDVVADASDVYGTVDCGHL
ncbi:MAG: hypothetical protein ACI92G_003497, partial [Candidatus Pelagisphaera sp.]